MSCCQTCSEESRIIRCGETVDTCCDDDSIPSYRVIIDGVTGCPSGVNAIGLCWANYSNGQCLNSPGGDCSDFNGEYILDRATIESYGIGCDGTLSRPIYDYDNNDNNPRYSSGELRIGGSPVTLTLCVPGGEDVYSFYLNGVPTCRGRVVTKGIGRHKVSLIIRYLDLCRGPGCGYSLGLSTRYEIKPEPPALCFCSTCVGGFDPYRICYTPYYDEKIYLCSPVGFDRLGSNILATSDRGHSNMCQFPDTITVEAIL